MVRLKDSFFILFALFIDCLCNEDVCYADADCQNNNNRYLLYDVNAPEGFNLRRDVYMRFAVLAHNLRKSENNQLKNFKLVLPPWSHLVHWKYSAAPEQIPWRLYFDVQSIQTFAPVIEMYDFFNANKDRKHVIDEVYILQHFEDMFKSGNFEDRMKMEKCQKKVHLNYFFYQNITAGSVKCLSYHGSATKLHILLANSAAKVILVHHAEVALHEMFGDTLYWQARRSMRFSKPLKDIANKFRQQFLHSNDHNDGTILPEDWRNEKENRNAKGGPYLSLHIRRKDFLIGRSQQVPSIDSIVKQTKITLKKLGLSVVFIATDTTPDEFQEIVQKLGTDIKVFNFVPNRETINMFKDGGVAIIDQIICSHAAHFVGTHESTFSFRIQEEREIMGFPEESTFNCFCKSDEKCKQPSAWKIVY